MDETLMKLRILAKAETTLLKASARRAAMRARLFAVAIGLVLLTVIMLNVAAYQYLLESMSAGQAALLVGAVNAVLAAVAVLAAMRIQPGPEEAMVRDIREMALAELSGDVDLAKDEFVRISGDLNRIRTNVSAALGIFKSGAPGAGSVGPLLGIITKMLKK